MTMEQGPVAGSDQGKTANVALKLSDLVYAKIAGRIRSGEYGIDARLPTENDLAEGLGVSRPVVREALARLRTDGAVVSRRGSGTYVLERREVPDAYAPLTSINDMRRLLEFRVSVEGETAWHAAHGEIIHRDVLDAAMIQLDRDLADGALVPVNDFEFHAAVAAATGNRFFTDIMVLMRESIHTAMAITPSFINIRSVDKLAVLHAEHRAIYDGIVARQPDVAREAMRTHLLNAIKRVFEGI